MTQETTEGRSCPLGATLYPEGANFSVYSKHATAVELLLFDCVNDARPARVIHIDPATNQVVGTIEDIEVPHGVAIAPDGSRIYVTDESLSTLDVVDAKSLKVSKRIPLSGRPNNVAVAKDGAHVYVGIAQAPGAVDGVRRDGLGLVGIRERVSDLGGTFRIEGKSGTGTRLTIELPFATRA